MSHVVVASADRSAGTVDDLVRSVVADVLGVPAARLGTGRHCPHCGSDVHGRPWVAGVGRDVQVSLSRADDLAVVAVSTAGPVGVDVEVRTAADWDGFDQVALHPDEVAESASARTRTWVRKESVLKATGDGLRVDPRRLLLSHPDDQARLINWAEVVSTGSTSVGAGSTNVGAGMWMWDLEFGPDHVGCVSVLAGSEPRISRWRAGTAPTSPTASPGRGRPGPRR